MRFRIRLSLPAFCKCNASFEEDSEEAESPPVAAERTPAASGTSVTVCREGTRQSTSLRVGSAPKAYLVFLCGDAALTGFSKVPVYTLEHP